MNQNPRPNLRAGSPVRRGSLLLELVICGMLVGVVLSAAIPTLGWIARERALGRQRQAALLEVGNLMERLTLLGWDELTPERAGKVQPSETLERELSQVRLAVDVAADPVTHAKRVFIELRWEVAPRRPAPPIRLATWVYQRDKPPSAQSQRNPL